jgi:hypothetical protein
LVILRRPPFSLTMTNSLSASRSSVFRFFAPGDRPPRIAGLAFDETGLAWAPPGGCRFAPTSGSGCCSGRCEPRPGTIPRLAYRMAVPPGLALVSVAAIIAVAAVFGVLSPAARAS